MIIYLSPKFLKSVVTSFAQRLFSKMETCTEFYIVISCYPTGKIQELQKKYCQKLARQMFICPGIIKGTALFTFLNPSFLSAVQVRGV